jgi:hypothetical protein
VVTTKAPEQHSGVVACGNIVTHVGVLPYTTTDERCSELRLGWSALSFVLFTPCLCFEVVLFFIFLIAGGLVSAFECFSKLSCFGKASSWPLSVRVSEAWVWVLVSLGPL